MLLSIPAFDLLHSQLDIELNVRVDPCNGKLTYNVKDIHSRPRQPLCSIYSSDLTLTLQSSPEDTDPGTLRIRIFPVPVAVSEDSLMNISEVSSFHALEPENKAKLMTSGSLFPTLQAQDSFGNVDSIVTISEYSTSRQGSFDEMSDRASLWTLLQETTPHRSDALGVPNPLSSEPHTLPLTRTGLDPITGSSDTCSFGDPLFDPFSLTMDHTANLADNATHHCSQQSINNILDIQGQPGVEASDIDSTLCGSFSIIDLLSPLPHFQSSPQASSTVVYSELDQIIGTSDSSTSFHRDGGSAHETSLSPSSSIHRKSPPELTRDGKRNLYPCPFPSCGRVLKSMYTQRIHLKTHERKPHKHFPCTMGCPESFTRHHDRLRHEVAQHGKQCEFSCKKCERFFSSQRMLDRHTCWSWRNGGARWQRKDTRRSET